MSEVRDTKVKKLTPAMQSVLDRMAAGQRLIVTRSSRRASLGTNRCSLGTLHATRERELIEYDSVASNGWEAVYRLTEAGRSAAKGAG
jgi:hypothetical protein